MGETMETNKTEATMENKSASVFFRVLKGFWRFIRFVFRLVFGPLGLAVLNRMGCPDRHVTNGSE